MTSCATPSAGRAIVLIGEAGFGKTTLWEAALESARERGVRVLAARPSETACAAAVRRPDRPVRPARGRGARPRCRGRSAARLEVALMRAEPAVDTPRPDAVPAAEVATAPVSRSACWASCARWRPATRVLIAVDDLQWLDPHVGRCARVRRSPARGRRVAFLLARRPGRIGALEAMLSQSGRSSDCRSGRCRWAPCAGCLFERLGLTVSRQRLRRHRRRDGRQSAVCARGGTLAARRGRIRRSSDDVPLPDSLEELLGDRVAALPAAVRRVLLAVALSEDPRVDQLLAIVGAGALDDAVDAGVVVLDGERVRAVTSAARRRGAGELGRA